MKRYFAFIVFLIAFFTGYAQGESHEDYDDGINKKWELKIDLTGNMASRGDPVTGDGLTEYDESMGVDLGVGYNINSNWYAGLSSGYWYHWGGESNNMIPVLGDVVWRWNIGTSEKYSLFLEGRAGMLFGLNGDRKSYKRLKDYQFSDHAYFDIQPGIYIRTHRNIDFRISLGYAYTKPTHHYEDKYFALLTEEELELLDKDFFYAQSEHVFSLKLGFNFRGKTVSPPVNWTIDDDIRYYGEEVELRRHELDRAERKAERAAGRVARDDKLFDDKAKHTQAKENDMVLYYVIPNADEVPNYQPELEELAEWARTHKKGRIILKSYVENDGKAQSHVSAARKRAKQVKDVLVQNYGIKARQIKTDIYMVSSKTARKNDIKKRVDIYKKEKK